MVISLFQIIILGLIQGAAEMLPVSSSAHVIVAEKFMGIDASSPEATFMLVMLHTGTMFAVLAYFWKAWVASYGANKERFWSVAKQAIGATFLTGIVGFGLKKVIEATYLTGTKTGEIEELFGRLPLIGTGLAIAGVLIIISGFMRRGEEGIEEVSPASASLIGVVQGICLPFRGLSRSGTTISAGLMMGSGQRQAEEFSFALAVILTPAVIVQETLRLIKMHATESTPHHLFHQLAPGLVGMGCSFVGGVLALGLLSRWLARGKWQYFGYYCLAASAAVFTLSARGILT
jgi:undecaprenyl-diphosphatase